MHMSRKHPAGMKPRDESAHPVLEDALDNGYLDTGVEYKIDGFATHIAANKSRLSINRAGQHYNVSTACWVVDENGSSCYKSCANENAPHGLRFRLHSKNSAREHVFNASGGDPTRLKYNPFQKKKNRVYTDSGQPK